MKTDQLREHCVYVPVFDLYRARSISCARQQCIAVMTSFRSISLRFINRTRQNTEIPRSVWKQTEAHRSVSAVKPIIWKRSWVRSECGFGDMKGV